jgi:peptide/nickel transport system substrate-binding protein
MVRERENDIRRRSILKTIGGTAGAGALAGCSFLSGGGGDGDGGDGDSGDGDGGDGGGGAQGERVPTIQFDWYSLGGVYDNLAEIVQRDIGEIGFDVNSSTGDFAGTTTPALEDTREHHLHMYGYGPSTPRLDPNEFTFTAFGIHNAGFRGPNYSNYANCEASFHGYMQSVAPDEETREEHVRAVIDKVAEDRAIAPLVSYISAGYGRNDLFDFQALGNSGLSVRNSRWPIHTEPKGDQTTMEAIFTSAYFETINWPTLSGSGSMITWSHTANSALWEHDENFELQGVLAEDWEYANDGLPLTVELRDGSFHNGDKISASDVKFTFEQLERQIDEYPLASEQPIDSIDVIDDTTVQFNWTEPNPSFQTSYAPTWGIMHEQSWRDQGAVDDPQAYNPDPSEGEYIGSGPWQIVGFSAGSQVIYEPHDDHPFHSTPNVDRMVWNQMDEQQAASNAVINGEMHVHPSAPLSALDRAEQQLNSNQYFETVNNVFTVRLLQLQNSFPPGMFKEWRQAIGMAMNRQEISQISFQGEADPIMEPTLFAPNHPFHPDEGELPTFTDDPTGDVEGAVQTLEDAGWSQDGDGNWRYPPDKDLAPPWPEGEHPSPDDFPCITEDGGYNTDYSM